MATNLSPGVDANLDYINAILFDLSILPLNNSKFLTRELAEKKFLVDNFFELFAEDGAFLAKNYLNATIFLDELPNEIVLTFLTILVGGEFEFVFFNALLTSG